MRNGKMTMMENEIEMNEAEEGYNLYGEERRRKDYFSKYPEKQNTKKNRDIEGKTTTKTSEQKFKTSPKIYQNKLDQHEGRTTTK
mmetsp:Transcript_38155/g.42199  ORF Transcript_38155/g.42199 Transcript_38155/m.42199 type:complete len:85 (+) Transcript_38155:172-426(+)